MKRTLLVCLLFIPLISIAQESISSQDTIIMVNGRKLVIKEQGDQFKIKVYEEIHKGDTIKNDQIFEGIYKNGKSTERRMMLSSAFTNRNQRRYLSSEYVGLAMLTHSGSMRYNQGRSWEIGIILFEMAHRFWRNQHWTYAIGAGVNTSNYGYKGNGCLQDDENGIAQWTSAPEGEAYKRTRFIGTSFYLPIIIDWQAKPLKTNTFFIQAGFEFGLTSYLTRVIYQSNKKDENIRYKNFCMYTANTILRIGYKDFGVYARYSLLPLFDDGKGPQAHPISVGMFMTL